MRTLVLGWAFLLAGCAGWSLGLTGEQAAPVEEKVAIATVTALQESGITDPSVQEAIVVVVTKALHQALVGGMDWSSILATIGDVGITLILGWFGIKRGGSLIGALRKKG